MGEGSKGTKMKRPNEKKRPKSKKQYNKQGATVKKRYDDQQFFWKSILKIVMIIAVIFIVLRFVLLTCIFRLDEEIKVLEQTQREVEATNDSLEGTLITKRNYEEIEAQARAFGMKDLGDDQTIHEKIVHLDMPSLEEIEQQVNNAR